jgi:hypothetical protein
MMLAGSSLSNTDNRTGTIREEGIQKMLNILKL